MDKLKTIKTVTYAHEAGPIRNILEANGIFCFLKDELTIQAYPFYSNALGGVKVQVNESEADQAIEILKQHGAWEAVEPQTLMVRNASGKLTECPSCGATDLSIVRSPSKILFAIGFFLFGFPLPYFTHLYHCYNCSSNIKVSKEKTRPT